jgi:dihydroorotate dehydrogenase electron transfer subunit
MMQTIPITNLEHLTDNTRLFSFNAKLKSKPGQFVMLWLPGIGQKPFSIAASDSSGFKLLICKRGNFTKALFKLKVKDLVGISEVCGTHFSIKPNRHYIMLAGGYGVAPLYYLATSIASLKNIKIDFCLGAKKKDLLILTKELQQIKNLSLHLATEDGSEGIKGLVTDFLSQTKMDSAVSTKIIVACGPEPMEKKVLAFSNQYNIACEISIEHYLKCGIGICGHCADNNLGICVCKEGPVITRKIANQLWGLN